MILFTADWHIKLGQKNVPVEWAKKRYHSFFDQVHEQVKTCDMHIIGGDLFDRIPNMEELALYFSFVRNVKKPTVDDKFVLPDYIVPIREDRFDNPIGDLTWKEKIWRDYCLHDVKEDRAVFVIKDSEKGVIVDAIGASTDNRLPKWKRYGSSRHPFVAWNGKGGDGGDKKILIETILIKIIQPKMITCSPSMMADCAISSSR